MDNQGNVVLKPQFEGVSDLGGGCIGYREQGREGIVDISGRIICSAQYKYILPFSDGLAVAHAGQKLGYINQTGECVVPCRLTSARQFSGGLAVIQETPLSPCGYINTAGAYQIMPQFRSASSFSEGLGAVRTEKGYGFVNPRGDFVIEPKFALVNRFSEGLSAVTNSIKTLKYGFIDRTGSFHLKPNFYGPDMHFSEGLAAVWSEKGIGFIDPTGTLKIKYQFYNTNHFSEGFCCVSFKKRGLIHYGFINKQGEMVIEPLFRLATNFQAGLAMVETKDCWGYINYAGEFVWSTNEPR